MKRTSQQRVSHATWGSDAAYHDADFEGITWLGKNRVLLASDDRVEKTARTVFAVIELELDN